MKARHPQELKEEIVKQRLLGTSLKKLAREFDLPKSTVQWWICQLTLSDTAQEVLTERARSERIEALRTRRIPLPTQTQTLSFSPTLVRFIAHTLFDGSIFQDQIVYYSSHRSLADRFAREGKAIFSLEPHWFLTREKVYRVHFYSKNLVDFLRERSKVLIQQIMRLGSRQRLEFLRAFFDDEGSVSFRPETSQRVIRGYQKDVSVLRLVASLLAQFEIESNLENLGRSPEITIRGQLNIKKFAQLINFSKGVIFRATRKNSYYSKPIEKRLVLLNLLRSY